MNPTMFGEIPKVNLVDINDKDHGINYDGNDYMSNGGWKKYTGALVIVALTATTNALAMATGDSSTSAWMILDGSTTNKTPV